MPLKTNYRDEILASGYEHRVYNIKQQSGGATVESNVYLERVDTPQRTGDSFQAADINATNTQVNANTAAITEVENSLENTYNKTETDNKLSGKQNTISYGSSLPPSGTEGQMFILI